MGLVEVEESIEVDLVSNLGLITCQMSFVSVQLRPTPGFTVKSTTLTNGLYTPRSPSKSNALSIPKGLKIFVNVAWDPNVPPPPPGGDDVIQKAMLGEEELGEANEEWYVPTVVSDGREDTDKGCVCLINIECMASDSWAIAGKLSLVFDAVFNSSLKSRSLKDPEFKTFLIGTALFLSD